jgi:hypothetical protein
MILFEGQPLLRVLAGSDIPGTFTYTPGIGTKLNLGNNQYLKVDFTPTDDGNYNSVSKTVKINVIASTGTWYRELYFLNTEAILDF